jgi:hypothetical protein
MKYEQPIIAKCAELLFVASASRPAWVTGPTPPRERLGEADLAGIRIWPLRQEQRSQ